VLLEVVLALLLFVLAAGVLLGSLSAAIASVQRIKRQATGQDLAVSVMSRIECGDLEPADAGPLEFEDGPPGWTWQVRAEDVTVNPEAATLIRLSVTVASPEDGFGGGRITLVQFWGYR